MKLLLNTFSTKISKETIKDCWSKVITFLKGVDNLYMKFILTIIAIALLVIASKLPSSNDGSVDVSGSVYISGSVDADVSGSVDADVSGSVDAVVSGSVETIEYN